MGAPIELGEGRRVSIRALGPRDREALAEGFERLGPQSRYLRFFSPVARLSDAQLAYLTDIDHHDHEALVAVDADTRDGVGVARFVRIGAGVAEPAVAVTDEWQRRGVGTLLLDALADRAREEGIEVFVAHVLADNEAALGLLDRLGDAELSAQSGEVEVRVVLPEGGGAAAALHSLLRHAAERTVRQVSPRRAGRRESR
jgi:RimJ/RimL family protein N-acetyltransferase